MLGSKLPVFPKFPLYFFIPLFSDIHSPLSEFRSSDLPFFGQEIEASKVEGARIHYFDVGVEPKIMGTPKWMVDFMENPKVDDLVGFPTIFGNTHVFLYEIKGLRNPQNSLCSSFFQS